MRLGNACWEDGSLEQREEEIVAQGLSAGGTEAPIARRDLIAIRDRQLVEVVDRSCHPEGVVAVDDPLELMQLRLIGLHEGVDYGELTPTLLCEVLDDGLALCQ